MSLIFSAVTILKPKQNQLTMLANTLLIALRVIFPKPVFVPLLLSNVKNLTGIACQNCSHS